MHNFLHLPVASFLRIQNILLTTLSLTTSEPPIDTHKQLVHQTMVN